MNSPLERQYIERFEEIGSFQHDWEARLHHAAINKEHDYSKAMQAVIIYSERVLHFLDTHATHMKLQNRVESLKKIVNEVIAESKGIQKIHASGERLKKNDEAVNFIASAAKWIYLLYGRMEMRFKSTNAFNRVWKVHAEVSHILSEVCVVRA